MTDRNFIFFAVIEIRLSDKSFRGFEKSSSRSKALLECHYSSIQISNRNRPNPGYTAKHNRFASQLNIDLNKHYNR